MILVDTSIFISYFKNHDSQVIEQFEYILDRKVPYGINMFIYQEILQGARNIKEYDLLKKYFDTIPTYNLKYGKRSYEQSALLNIKCKQNGITIRSTIDFLIAETAIENDLYLLHDDNDFINMAKIIKKLKLYSPATTHLS